MSKNASFRIGLKEWLRVNSQAYEIHSSSIQWSNNIFLQIIWSLWKQRSSLLIERLEPNRALRDLCLSRAREFYLLLVQDDYRKKEEVVLWRSPRHEQWIKLISDGAVDQAYGKARSGSILRNSYGLWIRGSIGRLGNGFEFLAELWGLLDGLRMTR